MPLERFCVLIRHLISQLVLRVCVTESVHRCDLMFQHIPLSVTLPFCLGFPSLLPLFQSLFLSPLTLLPPVLYFSAFLSSCCFIWLPDLSSLISVHRLHFDVSPHTATLTTTKTRPCRTLHLPLALCLSYNVCFCLAPYIYFSSFFLPLYSSSFHACIIMFSLLNLLLYIHDCQTFLKRF